MCEFLATYSLHGLGLGIYTFQDTNSVLYTNREINKDT